jgi:hypothetical protein
LIVGGNVMCFALYRQVFVGGMETLHRFDALELALRNILTASGIDSATQPVLSEE